MYHCYHNIIIVIVGDQVLISEPEGNFSQEQYEAADELVMLAAGTGKNAVVIVWLLCVN